MNNTTVSMILYIVIIAACFAPYITNAYKFSNCDFESGYKCEIIHGAGVVFPPSAIVTVWFDDDSAKKEIK